MRILLDPGHGGAHTGAQAAGIKEKNITLEIARKMVALLQGMDHCVILTRYDNYSVHLVDRLEAIQLFEPDAFLSVHANAMPGKNWRGVETFYRDEYDVPLATTMHKHMATFFGMHDRGMHKDVDYLHKRLMVLNDYRTPAALVEIGYLDDHFNRSYILENIYTIAEVLAIGLNEYDKQRRRA